MARVTREASAQRRRQLHAATVAELARTGPDDLALTAVAARCGVTTTAIYRRYPTRHDLIAAVAGEAITPAVADWLDHLVEGLAADRRPPRPPEATALAAWCQLCVAAAWPGPTGAVVRPVLGPPGGARTAAGGDGRPTAAALLVGSWLLATGLDRRPPPTDHQLRAARQHLAARRDDPATDAVHRPARSATPAAGAILDERGRRLVEATAAAIERVGYAHVSVNAIARRADTSTGALYNRFSGKAGLLAACLSRPDRVDAGRWGPRVEALRLGPTLGPEVAKVLDDTIGRPLRTRGRALAATRRSDPTAFAPDIRPATLAWVSVALPLGQWVVRRVLAGPAPASAPTVSPARLPTGNLAGPTTTEGHSGRPGTDGRVGAGRAGQAR